MTTYDLYLESGPKRRKTMVHVLDLLGCVATGPTTEDALAATPEAILAYRRFLRRHGEPIDPETPIETRLAEHVTEGDWLGNGSPYLMFGPDLRPVTDEELGVLLRRYRRLREELADWALTQSDELLDAAPTEGGRPGRAILLHILGATGVYLSAALGGVSGFSRLHSATERGEIGVVEALRRGGEMAVDRARSTTSVERAAVRDLNSRSYTLRKALRRMLEHDWEHLAELSRRPGGPML